MRYTIVTPTICRHSLTRLCASVDSQTQSDWEHLVVVDMPREDLTKEQRAVLASIPSRPNRTYFYCDSRHKNYGHTCRHQIWGHAKGEYIFYVDDDDYLADGEVLGTLDSVTEPWAVFPILRHGQTFLNIPPGYGRTGTGMFIHRREVGRWPDLNSYEADGEFIEELKQRHPFQVLETRPLIVQPVSSYGVSNAEGWFGKKFASLVGRWQRYRRTEKSRVAL